MSSSNNNTSCSQIFAAYKEWISRNPILAADVETTVKWVSYFVAGRIHHSSVLSELIYSLSNLLVLFNDRIIHYARNPRLEHGHKLKTFLTIVEYSEVFLEITAKRFWGNRGKWLIITIIQTFKCLSRLVLLLVYKEKIVRCPPIPPLRRKTLQEVQNDAQVSAQHESQSFTLPSSGRVIRSVAAAPPLQCRTWTALQAPPLTEVEEEAVTQQRTLAEVIYIVKPVCHLLSSLRHGQDQWRPYIVSLAMDLVSLQIYRRSKTYLSQKQRVELSRRTVLLLLYILRSPFYERYSRHRLDSLLQSLSNKLPLVRLVCEPLRRYIPEWQAIYFYMWSA